MNRTIKKTAITAAVLAVALSVCAVSAMAAGDETAASASCGYLNGQQRCQERRAYFANRPADVSGGDSVKELLEAGVITQDQADAISGASAD